MGTPILYVHGIEAIGGAERDLIALLEALDRRQWTAHVACPATGPLRQRLDAIQVPAYPLRFPPWRKLLAFPLRWGAVRRLRDVVNHIQPAMIHVNDIWWVPQVMEAVGRGVSRPPIVVAHVRQEIEPSKAKQYGLDRLQGLIAISKHVEAGLVAGGVASERVETIYSGIATPLLPPPIDHQAIRSQFGIPLDATVLVTVANLFSRKGYEVMLRALPAVLAAVPTVHYLVVGEGAADYADHLATLASTLKIEDRVHFAGFQEAVHSILRTCDLYVHPALLEGFGIAVVEAMAMGKAVVATTTGGLPEVVVDGKTGLLVPPGDDRRLSAAIVSLLGDRMRRDQMGKQGQARAKEEFTLEASVKKMERFYAHAVASWTGQA